MSAAYAKDCERGFSGDDVGFNTISACVTETAVRKTPSDRKPTTRHSRPHKAVIAVVIQIFCEKLQLGRQIGR